MIPFNFHHLYYFYSIVKSGNMSLAAKQVRVSQPALSAQIKQFEHFLGEKLFERQGRELKLTEEGRMAYGYAQSIFDTGREFMDTLHDRSQKGRLRVQIGVTNSIPKSFAAALLKFILREFPHAQILLHEDTLSVMVENLRNHSYDFILSDVPHKASEGEKIQNLLIGKVPIVFCATKSLASQYKRIPQNLDGAPLLLPTSQSGVYHAVLEYLAKWQVAPNIIAEIQDVELMHRMAMEGAGIAPLNKFSLLSSNRNTPLTIIPSGKHDIHDTAYFITQRRKKNHPIVEKISSGFRIST